LTSKRHSVPNDREGSRFLSRQFYRVAAGGYRE
jgi:hypothetical protein